MLRFTYLRRLVCRYIRVAVGPIYVHMGLFAGQIIWLGSRQAQTAIGQLYLTADAHLRGVHMGLHAAAALGVQDIRVNMPTTALLEQVRTAKAAARSIAL